MPTLQADIPVFYCKIRKEFLYDLRSHHGELEDAAVFGLVSRPGRALAFTVMLPDGAQFKGIPIHALLHSEKAPRRPLDWLQLWDCFGERVSVHVFDFLRHASSRCKVILKDRTWVLGTYMFTVDWWDNCYSDEPSQDKCAHVIRLDDGCFCAQPNNRILWFDPCLTTRMGHRPDYLVNTHVFKCEDTPKWVTEDSDQYFYDFKSTPPSGVPPAPADPPRPAPAARSNGHPA